MIGSPSSRKDGEQRHAGLAAGQIVRFLRAKTKAESDPQGNKTILAIAEPKEIRPNPWRTAEQRAKAIERMKLFGISNAEEAAKYGPDAARSLIEIAKDDQPNIVEAILLRIGKLTAIQGPPNENYEGSGPRPR